MNDTERSTQTGGRADAQLDPSDAAAATPAEIQAERTAQAGAMLRQLRQSAGVDLALLASALKVGAQKVQLLEEGRLDDLPGLTFARGLAAAICRYFAVSPDPVLALMPQAVLGLPVEPDVPREPFRPSTFVAPNSSGFNQLGRNAGVPGWLLAVIVLLLVAALAIWLAPEQRLAFLKPQQEASGAQPASSAASALADTASAPVAQPASAPEPPVADAASSAAQAASVAALPPAVDQTAASAPSALEPFMPAASAPEPAIPVTTGATGVAAVSAPDVSPYGNGMTQQNVLVFNATGRVWVGVTDGNGKAVLNRVLSDGDTVNVNGALPLSVVVGDKNAVTVTVRGQTMDLSKRTRGGVVARFTVEAPANP